MQARDIMSNYKRVIFLTLIFFVENISCKHAHLIDSLQLTVKLQRTNDKGKPSVREGRKTTGLYS